jgi:hypothetical protein
MARKADPIADPPPTLPNEPPVWRDPPGLRAPLRSLRRTTLLVLLISGRAEPERSEGEGARGREEVMDDGRCMRNEEEKERVLTAILPIRKSRHLTHPEQRRTISTLLLGLLVVDLRNRI